MASSIDSSAAGFLRASLGQDWEATVASDGGLICLQPAPFTAETTRFVTNLVFSQHEPEDQPTTSWGNPLGALASRSSRDLFSVTENWSIGLIAGCEIMQKVVLIADETGASALVTLSCPPERYLDVVDNFDAVIGRFLTLLEQSE